MGVVRPSWHAVPSWSRCGRGPPPGGDGGPPPKMFLISRPWGCILDNFWPIWLCVLALLRKAFAA